MKRLTQTVLLGLLGLGAAILGIEVWRAREAPEPAQVLQTPQIALPDLEGQIWRSDSAPWRRLACSRAVMSRRTTSSTASSCL